MGSVPVAMRLIAVAVGVLALLAGGSAAAAELRRSGWIALDFRWFPDTPQFADQFEHYQPSVVFRPEYRWRFENNDQVTLIPFLRIDSQDDERTHFDMREAFWRRVGEKWDVLLGVNRVFWGVTESRHLVDVINQVDGVEDIDEEERLGQPMINFSTQRDWGNVDLFVLMGFRERTFAGPEGRPRFALPVDTNKPEYESGAGDKHIDYVLRYSHVLGDWDIGAYLFYGTGREPTFTVSPNGTRLIPNYSIIIQFGTDIQYTPEAWLWKFEGIVREGQGDTFGALVAGFEYTFYQVKKSVVDVGVLLEYLYDGRDEDPAIAPPTPFDNDIFVGTRIALNDVQDTSILAGATIDIDDQSTIFIAEAERRLSDRWSLVAKGRFFINVEDNPLLRNFENDSYVDISVRRHF